MHFRNKKIWNFFFFQSGKKDENYWTSLSMRALLSHILSKRHKSHNWNLLSRMSQMLYWQSTNRDTSIRKTLRFLQIKFILFFYFSVWIFSVSSKAIFCFFFLLQDSPTATATSRWIIKWTKPFGPFSIAAHQININIIMATNNFISSSSISCYYFCWLNIAFEN